MYFTILSVLCVVSIIVKIEFNIFIININGMSVYLAGVFHCGFQYW
ncbi:Uncharacterised protein [Shimwellia blattae]|nr:Uncharacterised protein [Shimwellia blattae]VEC26090.1 Uncharacterised protein [Shimwellia blattae]